MASPDPLDSCLMIWPLESCFTSCKEFQRCPPQPSPTCSTSSSPSPCTEQSWLFLSKSPPLDFCRCISLLRESSLRRCAPLESCLPYTLFREFCFPSPLLRESCLPRPHARESCLTMVLPMESCLPSPVFLELCLSSPCFLESALAREPLFEPCLASNEFHSGPPGPDSTWPSSSAWQQSPLFKNWN